MSRAQQQAQTGRGRKAPSPLPPVWLGGRTGSLLPDDYDEADAPELLRVALGTRSSMVEDR